MNKIIYLQIFRLLFFLFLQLGILMLLNKYEKLNHSIINLFLCERNLQHRHLMVHLQNNIL